MVSNWSIGIDDKSVVFGAIFSVIRSYSDRFRNYISIFTLARTEHKFYVNYLINDVYTK